MKWNIEKTYLKEMASKGIPCIPTLWRDHCDVKEPGELYDELGVNEIIIKPVIGAGAEATFRLTDTDFTKAIPALRSAFANRSFILQSRRRRYALDLWMETE